MSESKPFGEIYLHLNVANGKGYVGQTIQGLPERWRLQVKDARTPKSRAYNFLISRAVRKHGEAAFDHQILSVVKSKDELDNLEKVWIILLQTKAPNGYNLTDGGDGHAGRKHTEESKQKIRKNRKGKGTGFTFNRGRVLSEEHKQNISVGLRGKPRSEKARANMSAARMGNQNWLGRHHTPETKAKMRAAALEYLKRKAVKNAA